MRVLVTGGTGFTGSHCAAALIEQGHEVRLFVRNPQKIAAALGPLGIHRVDHVAGDLLDPASIRRAVEGCDAVVHAAGMYSDDQRREKELHAANAVATECLFNEALRAQLDPIVYTSSLIVVYPPAGSMLSAGDPVRDHAAAYAKSKSAAERMVRRLQETGAPIVSIYPGNVHGPLDPTLGQNAQNVMRYLRKGFVLVTAGGLPSVDVRDLARLCVRIMEPGRGPRRYMFGGPYISNAEMAEILCRLTGRRLRRVTIPAPVLRGLGRLGDLARAVLGVQPQLSYDAAVFLTRCVPCDNSRAAAELGVTPRPAEQSVRDMLRWMYEAGVLTADDVGDLARP